MSQVAVTTGRVSLALTVGANNLGLSGPGFYELEAVLVGGRNIYRNNSIDLPLHGYDDALLVARRVPCFWIHLDTDDLDTNSGGLTFTLQTRQKINGSTERYLRREWAWLPAQRWGEEIEVRVMHNQKELVPWTKIVADPRQSPIVISIPTKTPSPAVIGASLPLRFSKYHFE